MKSEDDLVSKRLAALQVAKETGNVSEACRQFGISRTQFYEYRHRFEQYGLDGLRNRPPIHKRHPFSTPRDVEERIIELSLQDPSWGCGRISKQLKSDGVREISSPTVQKIVIRHGLGKREQRLLEVERRSALLRQ